MEKCRRNEEGNSVCQRIGHILDYESPRKHASSIVRSGKLCDEKTDILTSGSTETGVEYVVQRDGWPLRRRLNDTGHGGSRCALWKSVNLRDARALQTRLFLSCLGSLTLRTTVVPQSTHASWHEALKAEVELQELVLPDVVIVLWTKMRKTRDLWLRLRPSRGGLSSGNLRCWTSLAPCRDTAADQSNVGVHLKTKGRQRSIALCTKIGLRLRFSVARSLSPSEFFI